MLALQITIRWITWFDFVQNYSTCDIYETNISKTIQVILPISTWKIAIIWSRFRQKCLFFDIHQEISRIKCYITKWLLKSCHEIASKYIKMIDPNLDASIQWSTLMAPWCPICAISIYHGYIHILQTTICVYNGSTHHGKWVAMSVWVSEMSPSATKDPAIRFWNLVLVSSVQVRKGKVDVRWG